jgi:serine/threonine protein kinase
MTLAASTRLGPYEIHSLLGAGGMGEVYRARDTRLGRDVALKVLPEEFFEDEDRRARFEREARVLASLNHPGIAAIYAFEEVSGRHLLAMELAEGEGLDDKIRSGPLPLEESLSIARQIAEALEAAHEKGIVHRDLKPANVKVSPDGKVKLLDFGLAKIFEGDGAGGLSPSVTHSPTLTARATAAGVILGTPAYMSPEQARGRTVDKRTDVWGFGCVLYEMLTGKRAFEGETVSDTLAAVLMKEADWAALPGPTPTKIKDLLRRCLRREAKQRLHDIADARLELEEATAAPSGSTDVVGTGSFTLEEKTASPNSAVGRSDPRVSARGSKKALVPWLLAAAFAAAAGSLVLRARTPGPAEPIRVHPLTFSSRDGEPAASPDGRLVAFTSWRDGVSRIWVKQIAGGGEAPLTAGPDRRPRFSPDGSSILFLRNLGSTQAVHRVGLVGGDPRKLVDDAVEADWAPDGRRIAFVRLHEGSETNAALLLFDTESGRETVLAEGQGQGLFCPRWSPDGLGVAFARGSRIGASASWELLRVDPSTRRVTAIPAGGAGNALGGIAWSGDGRQLFFIQSASVMGDLSGAGSRLLRCDTRTGSRTTLLFADGLATINGTEGGVSFCDVLSPGRLLFAERLRRQNLREVTLGPAGPVGSPRLITEGASIDRQPTYSPDGRHVLFSSNRSGNLDLWLLETATGALRQLTDDAAQDWDPAFTPDGKHILWSCDRRGHLEAWIANADGSGARQLTQDGVDAENPTQTRDENWIVYWSGNPEKPGVWKIHPDGTGAARLISGNAVGTDVSPDGRYALYNDQEQSNLRSVIRFVEVESGRVVPFSITVPYTLGAPGIIFGRARWSPDGKSIYYTGQDRAGLSGVFVQDFAPGRDTASTRRPVAGFSTEYVTESLGVSPDGSRLTISTGEEFATILLAEGVPGAQPPLRKRP